MKLTIQDRMIRSNTIDKKSENNLMLFAAIVLSVPFFAVIAYTSGLSGELPIANYLLSDERIFHYPVIQKFAGQYPDLFPADYNSATTPLFHLVFSAFEKIVPDNIIYLRIIHVALSYTAILLLYKILTEKFKLPFKAALLLALLFEISPYFWGASFVLEPGNFAVLLFLLFFYYYMDYRETGSVKKLAVAIFWLMLLFFTRQTFLYVLPAVVLDILAGKNKLFKKKLRDIGIAGLSLVPTVLLFYTWNGLTPPSFIERHTATFFNPRTAQFGLAVLGLYAIFLLPKNFYDSLLNRKKIMIITILLSLLLLIVLPFQQNEIVTAGYIPRIAGYLPEVMGSSLIYYLLIPFGGLAIAGIWLKEGLVFFTLLLLFFLLSQFAGRIIFQRYYDGSTLLILSFLSAKYYVNSNADTWRISLLLLLFIAYFIIYPFIHIG